MLFNIIGCGVGWMRQKIVIGTSDPRISTQLSGILKDSNAGMAKLVDALDLGSSGATHKSSSLFTRTKSKKT